MCEIAVLKTLRSGSVGPQVEFLQLALTRAGFNPGRLDGIFGPQTLNALRRFQSSASIASDGIAGPVTWRALNPYLTGYTLHTVRYGDTLYRLSRRYGTTLRSIETANPDVDPFSLRTGSTLTIPFNFPVVPTNISFTPTVMQFCAEGLSARYPFIETGSAGRSVMSETIYYFKIGAGRNNVFYNGAHHANEWIVTPVLMKFLENYAKAYSSCGSIRGGSAEELFSSSTLSMIPLVNPDGVALVTGELNSGPYYAGALSIAEDYPAIPFPSGWKANIEGVDPNLQYPAGWENAREIKFAQGFRSPAPRDYVGAAPLEIPESRALYNFTRNNDFMLTLSYHTQGRVIYWRYLNYLPERSLEIGREFAAVSGYQLQTTPENSGYAGYKDWFILAYDRPGYTIEAGIGTAPIPLSQFDTIYNENEGILVSGLTATI